MGNMAYSVESLTPRTAARCQWMAIRDVCIMADGLDGLRARATIIARRHRVRNLLACIVKEDTLRLAMIVLGI